MKELQVVALVLFIIVLGSQLWQAHKRAGRIDPRVQAVRQLNHSMDRVIDIYESASIVEDEPTAIENIYDSDDY